MVFDISNIDVALPALKTYSIPDEQRENFMETMTSVYRVSADFEMKLPMFFYVAQDHNFVCRIIAIVRIYIISSLSIYSRTLPRS